MNRNTEKHSLFAKALAAVSALALVAAFAVPVFAQSVIADFSGSVQAIIGAYPGMVQGSVLTRAPGTTAYAASQTVCGATNTTVCAPGTIPILNINAVGRMVAKRVTLVKSASTLTNASFTLWFFSAAPVTATPNQFDGTSYTGPRVADMPNYLGSALCANGVLTSDTAPGVYYECTLNPGGNGAMVLQGIQGTKNIDYLLSTSGAYTPVSGETFTPFMGGVY